VAQGTLRRTRPDPTPVRGRPRTGVGQPTRLETTLTHGMLIVLAIILVAPFFYVVSASMKDSSALFRYPPQWLPIPPYFGNFAKLLFESDFLRWMLNTLIVAGSVTILKLFLDSAAGYGFAKLDFTGRRWLFVLMVALLMVPFGVILIPLWSIIHAMGLLNTYWALILPPLANPLGVFLMRQYVLALPKDLENAARLDGVSEFGIYWRIILPLIKPGLVVLAVVIFTDQYMSFIWPYFATTGTDLQVLTVGVAGLRTWAQVNYGLWSAASVMSLIPIAIVFLVLQRQFTSNSLAGALKQ
jgi:multiple sugar transport system permease protein